LTFYQAFLARREMLAPTSAFLNPPFGPAIAQKPALHSGERMRRGFYSFGTGNDSRQDAKTAKGGTANFGNFEFPGIPNSINLGICIPALGDLGVLARVSSEFRLRRDDAPKTTSPDWRQCDEDGEFDHWGVVTDSLSQRSPSEPHEFMP
jgi:hypothetical protein